MRIVRVREFGAPQVMRIEETDAPRPAAGQVAVDVKVAGATYAETIVRSGRYPLPLPYDPGIEVGGRVTEVGPGVDPSLLGARVVATTLGNTGGYAEVAVAEAGNVFAVPDGLTLDRAVPVFQAGAVAVGVLAAMRVRAGESVLVTAAAGRIGSVLVQLAKRLGAEPVIGGVGGPGKLAAAAGFGADVTVDYGDPGWVEAVRDATGGRGADVAVDAIGGDVGAQALAAAANGGRLGIYGFASGAWTPLDAIEIVRRGLSVVGPLGIAFAKPLDEQRADAERALAAAVAGDLTTRVHAVYPLEDAVLAHLDLESRRTVGAVLLAV
ncbi:zinc-binding dehydrogenase [Actinomadura rayongensis]|uniref:Zinc-binding dehydrogenase n=1 Tax=Actinomadura rayongensis TaxID=1429076 RepID=A0A6I4W0I2_9ACTN|nr:zinc-binding dehydrogenase [Actinomadura rayongensis]MXQ64089.1 zinc-binding dehydrogenase [Actinomadura rayongensis]